MKTDQPLVSVYITNYNYEAYLEESIQSVLHQSLQNFELIIIDDGSTDNSKEIIERYRETDGITIIYQQNKGLNITNNVAMRVAKGKYLMRLDADDFLEETALEEMSNLLEKNDVLGLVFPDYYYVDAAGQITGEERRHDFEKDVSLYDQPAHGACTMIRLSFLKKLGGYNESFTCQDGYDLWLKFTTHYTVDNINKPLFSYRRHGENLTTNEERILETRRAIKETFVNKEQSEESVLIIIPVRNTKIKGESWPLFETENSTILEKKIATCLAATTCAVVYIVSADNTILSFSNKAFANHSKVKVLERPSKLAGPNQTLDGTIDLAIKDAQNQSIAFNYVMTVSLDFPFTSQAVLDDTVNTLQLFHSDSVLSTRIDNKMYYQHNGHSLEPILDQEKFTRLERDALYRASGGVSLCTLKSFQEHGRINSGKVSHVMVDELTSFTVDSEVQFTLFKLIVQSSDITEGTMIAKRLEAVLRN